MMVAMVRLGCRSAAVAVVPPIVSLPGSARGLLGPAGLTTHVFESLLSRYCIRRLKVGVTWYTPPL